MEIAQNKKITISSLIFFKMDFVIMQSRLQSFQSRDRGLELGELRFVYLLMFYTLGKK